ncbi:MAG: TetR family transcriptional regulator [Pseudomonadota bacterium]
MARPKVTEQRAAEILDAFEASVAKYGVEGATLERVAEHAGLARALIRHHIGNRDALLDALVERVVQRGSRMAETFASNLPTDNRMHALLDGLFDSKFSEASEMRVISALLIAMNQRPQLATILRDWTIEFIGWLRDELAQAFPKASPQTVSAVASGIATLYFTIDSIAAMGDMEDYRRECGEAAQLLLESLTK